MKILITPVSVYPATATQIDFLPAEVYYGVTAKSQYILQNEKGQNLISDWVSMTPEQYQLWGNDDEYAINVFLENLNLTAVPSVTEQLASQAQAVIDAQAAQAAIDAQVLEVPAVAQEVTLDAPLEATPPLPAA